jgi:uncharacterized protein (DUF1800 family)
MNTTSEEAPVATPTQRPTVSATVTNPVTQPAPPPAVPEPTSDPINKLAGYTGTQLTTAAAALSAAALLAACGGGGGSDPAAPPPPPPPAATPTLAEASRFLGQASFAATDAEITRVQTLGYAGWLADQATQPRTQSHYDWMIAKGYASDLTSTLSFTGTDYSLWRKLISSPDVLRQRVALAWSEIMVISMAGLPVNWRGFMAASYMDVLEANALGNYRELLEAVTLSTGMGVYLNMRGNVKEDPAIGRVPDENYAREVLQLFSIGLTDLALDGTPKNGVVTDSYGQDTITGLAKVFTGWNYIGGVGVDPSNTQKPMFFNAAQHSPSEKKFLGVTVSAGTDGVAALKIALDTIANHPNVAPFISRQLIQRLVTSNPSPAYVARVAAVFNNNGNNVRGDLKAVVNTILLDSEARSAPTAADTTRGKLREPIVRFVQWARSFNASSPTGLWNIPNLSDPATRLGQSPLRAPSVFNFYRPGYVPPNSPLGTAKITAPEFQITNETTIVAWANHAQNFVVNGLGEVKPDYTAELAVAADAAALVNRVVLLLAANALAADTVTTITNAVSSISAATDAGKKNRVYAAIHLVLCAPAYLVQI